jgi:hypothetical protein
MTQINGGISCVHELQELIKPIVPKATGRFNEILIKFSMSFST